MKFRTFVILALIVVFLAGVFLQAQGGVEIRAASSTAVEGWQRVTAADGEAMWVSPATSLTSADIARSAPQSPAGGRSNVAFVFTDAGARKMQELSRAQMNQRIALLLDGKVIWAPVVRATIEKEAVLSGLSADQAQRLLESLKRK